MTPSVRPGRYCFGPFELQPDQRRLLRDGVVILLRPRAFDLLMALVDGAGHLVTKDELLARVWPKAVVEEGALHVQMSALRKAVGSDAIITVSGRGYQFALPVTMDGGEASPASRSKHNLPYYLTSFVGREQEIAQLVELVGANRLVTLAGAGGAGKTRLAIEVASRWVDALPDGVWIAELAALSDPRLVPQAVAQVLGLKEQPGKSISATVTEWLASKRVLLVLDNAEHLIDGCAALVDEILRGGPGVAILVASRERLGMTGELTYRVPSLTVPATNASSTLEEAWRYEGVRLFVERAKLVRPDFELTDANASLVASICARLDGMPLPIELAAARLRSMSVGELGERLGQRFTLLTDGSRAALPRHRTLRSAIDWSYDLLNPGEQAALRGSAVFAGGWTLASAERVCYGDGIDASEVCEQLTSLVDKSLVVASENAGATRYRMLQTVRQYALDRLRESGKEAERRAAHLACFVALAEAFFEGVEGPEQQAWFSGIAKEHANLRAALEWSVEASPAEGLRLANALVAFWRVLGHLAEGRRWLARLLDAFPSDGSTRERARGLRAAAMFATAQGDYAVGKHLVEESLALYRQIDDPNGAARAIDALAWLAIQQGHHREAEALSRESMDRARATSDRRLFYSSLGNLAAALHGQGRWAEARALYERALEVARELGTPFEIGRALSEIGRAEHDEGRRDLALRHFAEGMTILHGLGNRPGVIESLEGLACVAAAMAEPQRAARLWGAADALRQEIGNARSVDERVAHDRQVEAARAILGSDAFDGSWDEGRSMSLDAAVQYASDVRSTANA